MEESLNTGRCNCLFAGYSLCCYYVEKFRVAFFFFYYLYSEYSQWWWEISGFLPSKCPACPEFSREEDSEPGEWFQCPFQQSKKYSDIQFFCPLPG